MGGCSFSREDYFYKITSVKKDGDRIHFVAHNIPELESDCSPWCYSSYEQEEDKVFTIAKTLDQDIIDNIENAQRVYTIDSHDITEMDSSGFERKRRMVK